MPEPRVSIGLVNPKSPTNVGAVLRASGCFQAEAVFYTGERYDRAERFHTDTQNRAQSIPLQRVANLIEAVPPTTKVVCVDLVDGAVPLTRFEHPAEALYIFGPEDGTISQDIIDRADDVVYIPANGCLNLAATVNVVLYDRMSKTEHDLANNDQILAIRDRNNRVRVKS
ncbi:RNA methyltransferase [Neptunomonas phycophila]|uniref:RNA methyltransferase n=1 Tax=Neptunomonas phycophila TaxID=1572645 RepID=UPI0030F86803